MGDLFFIPSESDPTENGLVRYVDGEIRAWIDEQIVRMNSPIIRRELLGDLVVRAGTTHLQRDMVIPEGVDVTIEEEGEILLLGDGGGGGGGDSYYVSLKASLVYG